MPSPGIFIAFSFEKLQEIFGLQEILEILGILVLAVVVGWVFKRYVVRYFEAMAKRTDNDVDDRLVYFLQRFYKGILAFIALLLVFEVLNIKITPLLAGAGIAGVAVAYAAKDVISNFLSGIFLLVDQPVKIGDRIRIERIGAQWGAWGDVVDVGLRSTTVCNTDGVHVTYPNAKLADSVIMNFTPVDAPSRFRIRVLVSLDSDLEKALEVLEQVGRDNDLVLDEPKPPSAIVRSLYDEKGGHAHYGALLELRCFVKDIRVRTPLRSKLLLAINRGFDEAGIDFAQPVVRTKAG